MKTVEKYDLENIKKEIIQKAHQGEVYFKLDSISYHNCGCAFSRDYTDYDHYDLTVVEALKKLDIVAEAMYGHGKHMNGEVWVSLDRKLD